MCNHLTAAVSIRVPLIYIHTYAVPHCKHSSEHWLANSKWLMGSCTSAVAKTNKLYAKNIQHHYDFSHWGCTRIKITSDGVFGTKGALRGIVTNACITNRVGSTTTH